MTKILLELLLAAALVAPSAASAKEEGETAAPVGAISVGAKVGVVLPQLATELGTTWGAELEGAYVLPPLDRRLAVYAAFGYTQPKVSRTSISDPRLPAPYDGTQTQRELTLGAGVFGRLRPPGAKLNGYAGLGLRAYFLETITVGDQGGSEFGENREQSTRFGGVFTVGGELVVWRGAAAAELQLGASDLPHLVTGDVSTTALGFAVGYRLFF